MTGPVSVQAVDADDWREWRALRLAALADAPYAFGSTLEDWNGAGENRWRQRLRGVPLNLIAVLGQQPVGMVSASAATDRQVELISLWVAPRGRGCGVGDALIQAAASWARAERADCLVLAVREGNRRAIVLYQRNGFRDAGWASAATDPFRERRMVRALLPVD